jgi:DNA-binding NtrC family response regulator
MAHSAKRRTILIVDDEKTFCHSVKDCLEGDSLEILVAHTGAVGLSMCSRHKVDVVLLDQKLPDGEGRALCPDILKRNDQTKIIFITAYPSYDNAVAAIKAGAHDYLSKPFELEKLKRAVERALRTLDLERVEQLQSYKNDKESEETVLIGAGGGLAEVKRLVNLAASVDAPVLITGETGTGKNVVAKSIHYRGGFEKAAFISMNCGALPENLIEAELFGCEKGAFTGAVIARKGIVEMAEGGTLFLDEIGSMPFQLQSKLLSVLEEKKIRRLGGGLSRPVNVRIIAATNTDLEQAVRDRNFREDLYFRLNVIRIHLPPLRERREDFSELCTYFVRRLARGREVELPESELTKLCSYSWPGNVRELKNVLERAILLQREPVLRPSELLGTKKGPSMRREAHLGGEYSPAPLEEVLKNHILGALDQFSGNYTRTAKALGVSLSTLKRKLQSYGLR